jgi:starch-binding outer membrane protein SusE/F
LDGDKTVGIHFKKNTVKKLIIAIAACIMVVACQKPSFHYDVIMKSPVLTASTNAIILLKGNGANNAITFTWTNGSNYGTSASITYTLKIDRKGGDFSRAASIPVGQTYSRSFSVLQLNALLLDSLQLPVNTPSEIQVKLIDSIHAKPVQLDSSNIIYVSVVPFIPPVTALFITGDAIPGGWNYDNPVPMKLNTRNPNQFMYNEVLQAGEFEIPVAKGRPDGDFYRPLVHHPAIADGQTEYAPGGAAPANTNRWLITSPGAYKITLDISDPAYINIKPFTPYAKLWIVGDATPAGWDIVNPTSMVQTPGNPYEFTYTGPLKAGEFKIPVALGNWSVDYYMPPANHPDINRTEVVFIPGGNPDNKWQITSPGNYRVVLNQLQETISIQKQ